MCVDLTKRQKHCLVALLDAEDEAKADGRAYLGAQTAGQVARRLGFRLGPSQHGNGAKDGRSFSGHGARGKWTAGSLMALERRGFVHRFYPDLYGRDRIQSAELTAVGRETARQLRDRGVGAAEVEYVEALRFENESHRPLEN